MVCMHKKHPKHKPSAVRKMRSSHYFARCSWQQQNICHMRRAAQGMSCKKVPADGKNKQRVVQYCLESNQKVHKAKWLVSSRGRCAPKCWKNLSRFWFQFGFKWKKKSCLIKRYAWTRQRRKFHRKCGFGTQKARHMKVVKLTAEGKCRRIPNSKAGMTDHHFRKFTIHIALPK